MTVRSMLRAALGYVDAGWPVVPGATPYGTRSRRIRINGAFGPVWVGCSCGSAYCMSPAAHPLHPHWQRHLVTTADDVRLWWAGRTGLLPNILLACGAGFHVWSVPRALGSATVELLRPEVALSMPVAVTPTGRWHLFAAPSGVPEQLPPVPAGLDVAHLGPGSVVPAPPSTRGALGHDMWLREPQPRRLPPCEVVAAAVVRAGYRVEHGQPRTSACRWSEPTRPAVGY